MICSATSKASNLDMFRRPPKVLSILEVDGRVSERVFVLFCFLT